MLAKASSRWRFWRFFSKSVHISYRLYKKIPVIILSNTTEKKLENTEKYRYYVWFGTKDRMRKQKSKKKFGKAINITSNSN